MMLVVVFNAVKVKSVLSLLRRLSTGRYPHLLLSAGACSTAPAAINRYLVPTGCSAANPLAAVAAVDRWNRRADGLTTVKQILLCIQR